MAPQDTTTTDTSYGVPISPPGTPLDERRNLLQTLLSDTNPASRSAVRFALAALPELEPTTDDDGGDPAAPVGLDGLGITATLRHLRDKAKVAVDRIRRDPDLNPQAVDRKLASLALEREQAALELPDMLEASVRAFLRQNPPPPPWTADQVAAFGTARSVVETLLPEDAAVVLEHMAQDQATLPVVRAVLRRLSSDTPPAPWRGKQTAALELLWSLPRDQADIARERHERAQQVVADIRSRTAAEVSRYISGDLRD